MGAGRVLALPGRRVSPLGALVRSSESEFVVRLVDLSLSSTSLSVNPDQVVSVEQFGLKYSDHEIPPSGYSSVITLATGKQIKVHRPLSDVAALLGVDL